MFTKIIAWIMGIVGALMAVTNIEYIKYQSIFNIENISVIERNIYNEMGYTEKGNIAIIGAIIFFTAVCMICFMYSEKILNNHVKNQKKK